MKQALAGVAALAALVFSAAAWGQQVLNLRDADVRVFIQDVARNTGRTIIIDPAVQGKVSVMSDRPLSRTDYFEVFLSTLRANGLVVLPLADGTLRVAPAEGAARQATAPQRQSAASNFVTRVIPLNTVNPADVLEALRPLISREGQISASRNGSALVVADYQDNVDRIRALVRSLDTDRRAMRFVPLRNARAREVASAIETLMRQGAAGGAQGLVSIVAIDSANAVMLRGEPDGLNAVGSMIGEIDSRSQPSSNVRVVYLQHADARQMLPVLLSVMGQAGLAASSEAVVPAAAPGEAATAAPPAAGAVVPVASAAGRGSVARFEGANALIITGPADIQKTVEDVIRQLDTRREQVLVEALIVEVSDQAAKRLGVQYLLGGLPGSGVPFAATNYSNSSPNLLAIAGAVGARELETTTTTINGSTVTTATNSPAGDALEQAAVASVLSTQGAIGGFAGKLGSDAIFAAVINAVKSDNQSNLLSTPSIMTLDNQEAKILVGQEVPITTGQALSPTFENSFRTVQRQNVGIQLEVRPQIGSGGAIKLHLRQEVSSIAGPVSDNFNDLILNKRELETTISVDDGQIVALGGLIDDNRRKSVERIPLLGDIPGLGQLFRSSARTAQKTNLLVFIRPTIVKDGAGAQALAARNFDIVRRFQMTDSQGVAEIDRMLKDYWSTTAPTLIQPAAKP